MKIHKGDKVKVMAGKDKGAEAVVQMVYLKTNKVLVESVNSVTKHIKPSANKQGGIVQVNKPIDVSNVMLICPITNKPTRVGVKIIDGKKYRISKKSGEVISLK